MAVNEGNIHYVEFRGDTSQLRKEIDLLSAKLNTLSKNTSTETKSITSNTKNMASSMASSFSSIRSALVGAGITIGFAQLGKAILGASSELENIRTTFRVFTGSTELADRTLQNLKQTALESPLNFQDFVQGSKTLMGYGVSASQVTGIVKMLGDVSGGSADRFQRLSLAFGQVVGAGRLMGQEARQMINAGFNPLQFIAEKTGKSMAQLQDEMRKGQISVQDVADAFKMATSEGGRFYNLSQEITNTLQGQYNKLKESLFFILSDIGDQIVETFELKEVISLLSQEIPLIANEFIYLLRDIEDLGIGRAIYNSFESALKATKWFIEGLRVTADQTVSIFNTIKKPFSDFADDVSQFFSDYGDMFDAISKMGGMDIISSLPKEDKSFKGLVIRNEEVRKLTIEINKAEKALDNLNIQYDKFGLIVSPDKQRQKIKLLKDELKQLLEGFSKTGTGDVEENPLERIVDKIKSTLVRARKEAGDAIDALNKPFVDAQKKLNDYVSDSIDDLIKNRLSERYQALYIEKEKYNELIRLARIYGLDMGLITLAYTEKIQKIQDQFRKENLESSKKHADSLIGVFQKQVKAQSDLMMKLSGVSAKANLGELIRETDANKFNNYVNSIHSAVSDFYAQTPAMFGQALGEMVAQGADFNQIMDNFGQLLMGQFGKLLQQLGQSLIVLGTSSLVFQKSIEEMFKPGNPAAGVAAVAAGVALVAAGGALSKMSQVTGGQDGGTKSLGGNFSRSRSMTSGNTYQYGGANYATQTINLKVDLTGSITATPSGYSINKSFETGGRVTGRY